MRFLDIISDIETIAALGTARRSALRRAVQNRLFQYAGAYDWPHYRTRGVITTIDDYSTGTASVTQDSRTVTGASTVWSSAFVGRKLRIGSQNAWYDIASRESNTAITLRQPFQGATASGQAYTIFQDEYRLEGDVHKLLDLIQIQDSLVMLGLNYLDMDRWFPDPDTLNNPTLFSLIGRGNVRYTTGTVTVTVGSLTISGTSTNWRTDPQGLSRGNRLAVDGTTEVFTINTVDSDTSLTVYESPTTTSAAAAYRIFLDNILVKVQDVPDASRNLYYRYQRIPYPLVNDYDEPDMPREYQESLVWAGLITGFQLLGNTAAAAEAERRWLQAIATQRSEIGLDSPAVDYPRASADAALMSSLRLGYGRLPTNYGYPIWL